MVWRPWGHQIEVVGGRRKSWRLFPRHPWGWAPQTLMFSSIHLQVCRRGPVLPASQGIHSNRAAERAGAFPVQPQAEALFTEHVLAQENHGISELSLADGADGASLRALLPCGSDPVIL